MPTLAPNQVRMLSGKEKLLKWGAISCTALLLLFGSLALFRYTIAGIILGIVYLASLEGFFYGALILNGIGFAYLAVGYSGIVLFRKRKYIAIIVLDILLFGLLMAYAGEYLRPMHRLLGRLGFFQTVEIPRGMPMLPRQSLPSSYYPVGKPQVLTGNPNSLGGVDEKIFYQEFRSYASWTSVVTGNNYSSISIKYNLTESDCYEFDSNDFTLATCKLGACVKNKSEQDNIDYAILDTASSACTKIEFKKYGRGKRLSNEEMLQVVDAVVYISGKPGGRVGSVPEILELKEMQGKMESRFRTEGVYPYPLVLFPFSSFQSQRPRGLSNNDCGGVQVDLAPDRQSYVLYSPMCYNKKLSFCIENGLNEVVIVPTEIVQKTYHCKNEL